jgi:hypothetical protein
MAFREDESRIRKNNAPANFAVMRHIGPQPLRKRDLAQKGHQDKMTQRRLGYGLPREGT